MWGNVAGLSKGLVVVKSESLISPANFLLFVKNAVLCLRKFLCCPPQFCVSLRLNVFRICV